MINSYTTNSIVNTSSLTITSSGTNLITGTLGFNCNCLRQRDTKKYYTSTGETYVHNNVSYEIYQSKYGLAFIWLYSKNNLKYRKYLK